MWHELNAARASNRGAVRDGLHLQSRSNPGTVHTCVLDPVSDTVVRVPLWSRRRGCPRWTKKRKSYTPEYRREAAHLVIDTGRTMAAVAREIGVGDSCWAVGWRWSDSGWGATEAPLDASDGELERLRRENGELRMDNEFLGKAAAFFASKNTPTRSASK